MPTTESISGARRPFRIRSSALDDKGIDIKKKIKKKKYAKREAYDVNSDLGDRGFVLKQTLYENQPGNVRATAENCVRPRPYTSHPLSAKVTNYRPVYSVTTEFVDTGACFHRRGVNIFEIGSVRRLS